MKKTIFLFTILFNLSVAEIIINEDDQASDWYLDHFDPNEDLSVINTGDIDGAIVISNYTDRDLSLKTEGSSKGIDINSYDKSNRIDVEIINSNIESDYLGISLFSNAQTNIILFSGKILGYQGGRFEITDGNLQFTNNGVLDVESNGIEISLLTQLMGNVMQNVTINNNHTIKSGEYSNIGIGINGEWTNTQQTTHIFNQGNILGFEYSAINVVLNRFLGNSHINLQNMGLINSRITTGSLIYLSADSINFYNSGNIILSEVMNENNAIGLYASSINFLNTGYINSGKTSTPVNNEVTSSLVTVTLDGSGYNSATLVNYGEISTDAKNSTAIYLSSQSFGSHNNYKIMNYGSISSTGNDLVIAGIGDVNQENKLEIDNNGIITGYIDMNHDLLNTGKDNLDMVTHINNHQTGQLLLKNSNQGDKKEVVWNLGKNGIINNSGYIGFDQNHSIDGTNNHVIFTGINQFRQNKTGIINLSSNNIAGDTFIISGDYYSDGGTIYLDTRLDNGLSNYGKGLSDILVTNNVYNVGNSTLLYIRPTADSTGDIIRSNGILIVDAKHHSDTDSFKLANDLYFNEYEYILQQKGSRWYLTNSINDKPIHRIDGGVELGQQSAIFRLLSPSRVLLSEKDYNLWGFYTYQDDKNKTSDKQIRFNTRADLFNVGGDIAIKKDDSILRLGLWAHQGRIKTNAYNILLGKNANGVSDGYGLGAYFLWFKTKPHGPYIDGHLIFVDYKNNVYLRGRPSYDYRSKGYSATVNGGYPFVLNDSYVYEPNLHLGIAKLQNKSHYDGYQATRITSNSDWDVDFKIGQRLTYIGSSRFMPYLEVGVGYNSYAPSLSHNNRKGIKVDEIRGYGEVQVGGKVTVDKNWTIWADGTVKAGQKGYKNYNISAGARYSW